mmetsp:Transcript_52096/g.118754  ORF Transcript_52096/g.118754 Transcript_52096/m.118754 type:complete len:240 (+) Transcript_52096:399-1118(+)
MHGSLASLRIGRFKVADTHPRLRAEETGGTNGLTVYDLDHDPGESTPLAAEAFDQVPLVLPLAVSAKVRKEESYRQTQSMYASRVAELEAEMLKAAERKDYARAAQLQTHVEALGARESPVLPRPDPRKGPLPRAALGRQDMLDHARALHAALTKSFAREQAGAAGAGGGAGNARAARGPPPSVRKGKLGWGGKGGGNQGGTEPCCRVQDRRCPACRCRRPDESELGPDSRACEIRQRS